ncbi:MULTISPECIES: PadR family transcriptional regulator [Amniculibacterium]|uniref:PadR family transcriptional regulator n=1 Tax=Amniculibacterium TaxID=2715289 RepID=UPI000F59B412|nr:MULTISPECIES: PadR family transcriptional regulator [Amniculibacterium]
MSAKSYYKGTLQSIILKMLSVERKMYGYQMTQLAKQQTEGHLEITEGALYPILHKLEVQGLVVTEVQTINGRDRKYYKLTDKGLKQQSVLENEMNAYILSLQNIFKP